MSKTVDDVNNGVKKKKGHHRRSERLTLGGFVVILKLVTFIGSFSMLFVMLFQELHDILLSLHMEIWRRTARQSKS